MKLIPLRKRPHLPAIFRWRYLAPRLALVGAIVAGVRFGLDPALRATLIASGEAALGAKVDVASVETSLRDGEMTINGIAATNPGKPMRNLLESASVRLKIDTAQLLRKRLVVRDGRIEGLRFDSQRATSGAIETTAEPEPAPTVLDPLYAAASDAAVSWFDDLTGRMEQDLLGSLATPQMAEELKRRWPEQYQQLSSRVSQLRLKSKRIEDAFREAKKNPLRNMDRVAKLRQELLATETELRTALAEIKALPEQARADRAAIDAARKRDAEFLREHLKLSGIDPDELNRYLLGETATSYLEQAAWWTDQVQKFIPKNRVAAPERIRGTNVRFAGRKLPAMLIERVELAGEARIDGQPLLFVGQLTDVASEPARHAQPTQLSIRGSGAIDGLLTVTLDRRSDTPHDSLVLDIPKMNFAHRTLGKADKLAVSVAPGEARVKAEIHVDGDELSGTIELRQASTLAAETKVLRDDRIAEVIHKSLSGVDRLEAKITLAGRVKRPSIKIESNVGSQLAAGARDAATKYLAERKDRVMAKVQAQVDQQLASLQAERDKAQQELTAALGENQELVKQLVGLMGGSAPVEVDVAKIGKSLDLGKLKR